jgi:hypothetical protein
MGDREVEEMEKEGGLVNGNAEHIPTDMDVEEHVQPAYSLSATQVQDMKVLLSTLSLLSRSVQVPNRLLGKVTSIAQKSDWHSEACKVSWVCDRTLSIMLSSGFPSIASSSRVRPLFNHERCP